MWQVPKIWEGGDVWIIGGGPSMTKQFDIPDKVLQDVVKGIATPAAFSPYMSCIHNKHVIGINVAYLIGDWIDMVFFGDHGFFLSNCEKLAAFPGLKLTSQPQIEKFEWVKYVARDNSHPHGISSNPKMVSWNGNSGAAAISVAAHAGAKRIMLLGFDMKLDSKNHQHWHDLYGRQASLDAGTAYKKLPFERHLSGFPAIATDAKKLGIEIINVSQDSAITEFRKATLKELL